MHPQPHRAACSRCMERWYTQRRADGRARCHLPAALRRAGAVAHPARRYPAGSVRISGKRADRPCLWCGGHRGAAETGVCAHLPPQHDPGRGALCAGRGADPGHGHAGSTRLLDRCRSRPAAGHCGRCSTVVHPGRDDPGQL